MTMKEYNALPKDVQGLIDMSFKQYLRDKKKPLTSPEQLAEFVGWIEWRVDSGLMYSSPITSYNPQFDEGEEETPVEYLMRMYGIEPGDIGVDDESELTNEEVDRLALKYDLDPIQERPVSKLKRREYGDSSPVNYEG